MRKQPALIRTPSKQLVAKAVAKVMVMARVGDSEKDAGAVAMEKVVKGAAACAA
jgi:hypothetical protein